MILMPILKHWLGNDNDFSFLVTDENGIEMYCEESNKILFFDYYYHDESLNYLKNNLDLLNFYQMGKREILTNLRYYYS